MSQLLSAVNTDLITSTLTLALGDKQAFKERKITRLDMSAFAMQK